MSINLHGMSNGSSKPKGNNANNVCPRPVGTFKILARTSAFKGIPEALSWHTTV